MKVFISLEFDEDLKRMYNVGIHTKKINCCVEHIEKFKKFKQIKYILMSLTKRNEEKLECNIESSK